MRPVRITVQDVVGEMQVEIRIGDLLKLRREDLIELNITLHKILYPAVSVPETITGMPIQDLPLRQVVLNALRRASIDTVGELAQVRKADLYRMRQLGPKAVRELVEYLESIDVNLKD
jgi:DNA-directed RNA polymerase alpha subunit